jgi:prophage antirepressor-like protein
MWAVNESGLYSLLLGSRKPEAKRFKRWNTHDVLPAIRKTGTYTARASLVPQVKNLANQSTWGDPQAPNTPNGMPVTAAVC